jgi:hypothetical protein
LIGNVLARRNWLILMSQEGATVPVPFTWQYPKTAIGRRIGLAIPGGCSSDFTGVAFPSGNADIEAAFATAGEHRIEACSSVTGRSSRSGISKYKLL